MGRKKKTEQQTQINKTSTIKYNGSVTVQLSKNGKIIKSATAKNAGYDELFRFLTNCIAGDFKVTALPSYIMGYNATGSDPISYTSLFSSAVYKADSQAIYSSGDYKAVLKFIIPANYLLSGNMNTLMLYNAEKQAQADPDTASAIVTLSDVIDTSSISKDTSLILLWNMSFSKE